VLFVATAGERRRPLLFTKKKFQVRAATLLDQMNGIL
jgi:hypothetical protein